MVVYKKNKVVAPVIRAQAAIKLGAYTGIWRRVWIQIFPPAKVANTDCASFVVGEVSVVRWRVARV